LIEPTGSQQPDTTWAEEVGRLFTEHYDVLYRAAFSVLRRAADAEDAVNNLFLKLLQLDSPPAAWKNPKAYLYRTIVNDSLNMIRSRDRRREADDIDDVMELEIAEPSSELANDNISDALHEALAKLKPEVREIFMLHHVQGYSDEEIAELLGQPRTTVASTLSRARAKLKKILGPAQSGDRS
jgi:RNA polymerase sigma-70 factor (ECF subfamily)